jgi:hypothetical protein
MEFDVKQKLEDQEFPMFPPIKKMAFVSSYIPGETYGLLGPQIAASIIQEEAGYDCMVIAVTREDDKGALKKILANYFGTEMPVIGFSMLSGRTDLFLFARELKEEGAITILAGPQADVDYTGESDWLNHPHRFRGLSVDFSFALHGPAQQIIPFLLNPKGKEWRESPGFLYADEGGGFTRNRALPWDGRFLQKVLWRNLFRLGKKGLEPVEITLGQVLEHLGCPHASRARLAQIDYPVFLSSLGEKKVRIYSKGCSFCDVAVDKGFHGSLDREAVLAQIQSLPERADGTKIPFELINENALPGLPLLLREIRDRGFHLSQVNLTLRADWFLLGEVFLREALALAKRMKIRFLLASMGFESFDDRILANLNKGLDVETNLKAIRLMRRIKEEFPDQWGYARNEGANHGFIHPTPWDTPDTERNTKQAISLYALEKDILPDHSVPLIIHHASALGDWIREIERVERIEFKRDASIIAWWQAGDRIVI